MLALKASLALAALWSGGVDKASEAVWKAVQPKAALLTENGQSKGYAMLVDTRGYFVAHQSALPQGMISGSMGGMNYNFQVLTTDSRSQLVLLKATDYGGYMAPLRLAKENPTKGSRVIAITLEGPFSAEVAADDLVGLQNQTGRYVPFNEVRIETPSRRLGGAWVVNANGEVVGIIGAALQGRQNNVQRAPGNANLMQQKENYGPGDLLVAYSLPVDVLERVFQGFLSPKRAVEHPEIGIEFVDSKSGNGAIIRSIVVGGNADKGGLRMGDVIVALNGKPTPRATQLAAQLFRLKPGSTAKVTVVREKAQVEVSVKVGAVVGYAGPTKLATMPTSPAEYFVAPGIH